MEGRLVLTVGPESADLPGFTHTAIQAAVDHVAALGGGTVRLLPGVYTLRNAIRLRRFVRLEGAGEDTHLVKAPEVATVLAEDSDWYERVVRVADARGFEVGDGIVLQGQCPHGGPAGLHKSKRTIVAVEGNRLHLERTIDRNFWIDVESTVSTLFPLLWGEETSDIEIASLRLDGNGEANGLLDGNHAGCIFLQYVERALIEDVVACNYRGDGISWQVAHDVSVLRCRSHDNANLGLHPGSGSQRPIIRECRASGNHIGLFWCWGVKHGLAEDNVIEDNRDEGVSIGHRDTDNLMRGNVIARNGKVGVLFRGEKLAARLPHRNVLEGNEIVDNGAEQDGYGVWIRDRVEGTVIRGNRFRDTGAGKQRVGVAIEAGVGDVVVAENRFENLATEVRDLRSGG